MKFIHLADLHIGGWREEKMSALTVQAFASVVDECISRRVDFAIISGDFFNTALPNIEYIKEATRQLKRLKDENIPVYAVAGSHDYSPSGKTMLDVLENAGLLVNLAKASECEDGSLRLIFTVNSKTGAKLAGMPGRKAMLERSYYKALNLAVLESEPGFKIFVFHTALDELKPEDLKHTESSPISFLPRGFDYYAGGHVHIVKNASLPGYRNVVYPGPLFPNSFAELEKLGCGTYFVYDNGEVSCKCVALKEALSIAIDSNNLTPLQAETAIYESLAKQELADKIVLLRLKGKLRGGRLSDINLRSIVQHIYAKGAYCALKNTSAVLSDEFEEIKKSFEKSNIEEDIINEHLGQLKVDGLTNASEKGLIMGLIEALSKVKHDGETVDSYSERIAKDSGLPGIDGIRPSGS